MTASVQTAELLLPSTVADVHMQPKVIMRAEDAPKVYTAREIVSLWLPRINFLNLTILTFIPAVSLLGAFTTPLQRPTAVLALIYFVFTGLGITAGYHRLFAHRSYTANFATRFVLMLAGSGALEGSIKWWCGGHRIHHRYTDTPKDPYNSLGGFWYAHIGWMLIKPDPAHFTKADIRDLNADPIVRWQHSYFMFIGPFMSLALPTLIAGLGWGDWVGGYVYAGAMRLFFVHHSTFCINSVAHYLGEQTFDDARTPRDNIITALLTFGEGYHNFHHEFPNDYRNGIRWYHWDPTKWLILALSYVGAATKLREFPMNEIKRGVIFMKEKKLNELKAAVVHPPRPESLPLMSWGTYVSKVKGGACLVLVEGLVHDVTAFVPLHPGGEAILRGYMGTDASRTFLGQTTPVLYKHSHAAENLLANMRVARIDQSTLPVVDKKAQ